MSEQRSSDTPDQPDQPDRPDRPEEHDPALWARRALRWDMADAGRAAWTPEATHCADPTDCPTYLAALTALRLSPNPSLDADDLTRAWRSGYDDAADTHATAERWRQVLALLEHHRAPDDLDS